MYERDKLGTDQSLLHTAFPLILLPSLSRECSHVPFLKCQEITVSPFVLNLSGVAYGRCSVLATEVEQSFNSVQDPKYLLPLEA